MDSVKLLIANYRVPFRFLLLFNFLTYNYNFINQPYVITTFVSYKHTDWDMSIQFPIFNPRSFATFVS